jgi:hypothetical protein
MEAGCRVNGGGHLDVALTARVRREGTGHDLRYLTVLASKTSPKPSA